VSVLGRRRLNPRRWWRFGLHGYAMDCIRRGALPEPAAIRIDFVIIVALDPPDFPRSATSASGILRRSGAGAPVPAGSEVCARRQGWSNSAMSRLMAREPQRTRRNKAMSISA